MSEFNIKPTSLEVLGFKDVSFLSSKKRHQCEISVQNRRLSTSMYHYKSC